MAEVARLASNEWPSAPFPEVQEAIARAGAGVNRYPDNAATELTDAMAAHLGVPPDHLMFGGGSNSLLLFTALAVGGPGTSAVYATPSFKLYRIATIAAGAEPIEVPLDAAHRHDLDAMADAVTDATTVVYVCNPNNPTSTHVSADGLAALIDAVPGDTIVAVDEAYAEFATADDFRSAIPHALERDNVIVFRTFSKFYGLAGLRLGYAIGRPETLLGLRKVALPFAASSVAQAAAVASLSAADRLGERIAGNASHRTMVLAGLRALGVEVAESQANFVWMEAAPGTGEALTAAGVLTRDYGAGWLRVSIGDAAENERFLTAMAEVVAG